MTIKHFAHTVTMTGVALFMTVAVASAATVTFNTTNAGTGFNGGSSLTLNSTGGAAATLVFSPVGNTTLGVPSNVSLGIFDLTCVTCSTQAGGVGSTIAAFTIDLILTDVTSGATGMFVGTSTGGTIYKDVSPVNILWSPLQLGPGSFNVLSGDFGDTKFTTTVFTGIVAPNSGTVPGQSTVQGTVDSAVPEPATFGMIGGALLGLALLRRRKIVS